MLRSPQVAAIAAVIAALALASPALAQMGEGRGMAAANSPLSLQSLESSGNRKQGEKDEDVIKDAKRDIDDADPRVRVQGLEKLRYVQSTDANDLLFRGLVDSDVRVRIKAIDVLGARSVNDAVPAMSQELFLRETPAVEKLHLVAALGRIGDQRGTMPVIEYLKETQDSDSRGTAVFALGEMADPRANDTLIQIVDNDPNATVRKLAQEALEKIDGELPSNHQAQVEAARDQALEPTDEKLAKMRQIDEEIQKNKY
ncbi:MAG TPA: HEAT repeat domain-containing protein [Candidatus Binataceae bacterium]|nr:HEAT repeat domain-containing protein [Candidatus Binataceae bacterium]